MPQPRTPYIMPRTVRFELVHSLALAAVGALAGCASEPKNDIDLNLKWKDRLNIVGPSSPSPMGRVGEKLILVDAEIGALIIPFGRPASLQDDRAKVVFEVKHLPPDAPRPIGHIDLWCPDSLIRERAWQVGSPVTVRLLQDYSFYDVADRR